MNANVPRPSSTVDAPDCGASNTKHDPQPSSQSTRSTFADATHRTGRIVTPGKLLMGSACTALVLTASLLSAPPSRPSAAPLDGFDPRSLPPMVAAQADVVAAPTLTAIIDRAKAIKQAAAPMTSLMSTVVKTQAPEEVVSVLRAVKSHTRALARDVVRWVRADPATIERSAWPLSFFVTMVAGDGTTSADNTALITSDKTSTVELSSTPIAAISTDATEKQDKPKPQAVTQSPSAESSTKPQLVRINIDLSMVQRSSEAYNRFKAWVDRAVGGDPGWDFRASDAAIMFQLTREVRYCTLGVRLVEEQVAKAEAVIAGGGKPAISGNSYLQVGPMLADLSHVYQTCRAQTTASQRQRWANYAEQAVWNIWNYANAKWGGRSYPWTGWSVDNPGNNYHFSFLEATMYWALASGSRTWHDLLGKNKLPKLQAYYANNPGGGSLEGTGYGTAQRRLFDLYHLWRNSTGQDLAHANPHARNTIDYWIHATVPTRNYFAPIGDQSRVAVPELYDYQRHLVLTARNLAMDAAGRDTASWWLRKISVPRMNHGTNLRHDLLLPAGSGGAPPAALHYVAQGTGHVFARTDWNTNAMWMAFVAGPFNESHAHQDQGSFTLYSRGKWLAVTQNIWSRNGIQQGTQVHNVVRFDRSDANAQQCNSPAGDRIVHQCRMTASSIRATPNSNGALSISANLTPVYRNNPAVHNWNRRVNFGNRQLTIFDEFSIPAGSTATFQLNVPAQPTIVDPRTVVAGDLRVRVLQPANATIRIVDWSGASTDESGRGWRIDISGSRSMYQVQLSEQ